MPRFQSKNGRRIRPGAKISKVINQASTHPIPSLSPNTRSNTNVKPSSEAQINKTIQEVQGGATPAKLDKMVSNAVESNRKLQKFIKFTL
jgi:hypothetical protein